MVEPHIFLKNNWQTVSSYSKFRPPLIKSGANYYRFNRNGVKYSLKGTFYISFLLDTPVAKENWTKQFVSQSKTFLLNWMNELFEECCMTLAGDFLKWQTIDKKVVWVNGQPWTFNTAKFWRTFEENIVNWTKFTSNNLKKGNPRMFVNTPESLLS